jgi:hypothetical protein
VTDPAQFTSMIDHRRLAEDEPVAVTTGAEQVGIGHTQAPPRRVMSCHRKRCRPPSAWCSVAKSGLIRFDFASYALRSTDRRESQGIGKTEGGRSGTASLLVGPSDAGQCTGAWLPGWPS